MSEPFEQKLLEALIKSPCDNMEDLRHNQQVMQGLFTQIMAAPFLFINNPGDWNTIVSFEDSGLRLAGPLMYAVSTGIQIAPAAANGWIGIVGGKIAVNKKGEHPQVIEQRFFLRGKDGQNYDLAADTVFMWAYDRNGERIVIADPLDETGAASSGSDATYSLNGSNVGQQPELDFVDTASVTWTVTEDGGNNKVTVAADSPIFWGKAQHQWAKNSGSPIVSIKAVPGYPSSTTEVGAAFDCALPNPNPAAFDPNVRINQYIPYKLDDSGNAVCVGDYLDAKIKSARWYLGDPDDLVVTESTKNISGWGWMDGTANASGNGGTGINSKGYYSFNSDTDTGAIGASELTAAGTHTHGGNTASATTGITADAHPSHIHRVMTHCGTCQLWECSAGQTTYLITGFQDDHSAGNNSVWTGIQKLYSTDHTVDHDDLTLSHTINDPGHYHANDMSASHSDPNKFKMYLVERLDNSFETLSI